MIFQFAVSHRQSSETGQLSPAAHIWIESGFRSTNELPSKAPQKTISSESTKAFQSTGVQCAICTNSSKSTRYRITTHGPAWIVNECSESSGERFRCKNRRIQTKHIRSHPTIEDEYSNCSCRTMVFFCTTVQIDEWKWPHHRVESKKRLNQ